MPRTRHNVHDRDLGKRYVQWIPGPVGTRVRSAFRAPWTGIVMDYFETGKYGHLLAEVRVTHDRRGNPLRKPLRKVLSPTWLYPLEEG